MAERRETRPVRTKLNPQHELSENVRLRSENEMLRITNAQLANELAVARASLAWWRRLAQRARKAGVDPNQRLNRRGRTRK